MASWACSLFCNSPIQADESGMQTSIAVDITADTSLNKETESNDRLFIREAEVMFYGPIDHLFDGQLSLAAHTEGGETLFEVHEAYIASSQLIPNSRVKVGQFFLGVGRLNQIHRHDWPFIEAPHIQKTFFDEEAAADSGFQWSSLLPLPFYLDFTIGATNGYTYGHSHDEGAKPRKPTHYLRLMNYVLDTAVGLNYLSRTSNAAEKMTLTGLDLTFKSRSGKTLTWLVQTEFWMREMAPEGLATDRSAGTYLYVQHGFSPEISAGLRG